MFVHNFNTAFHVNSHAKILIAFLVLLVALRGDQPLTYRLMSWLQRGHEAKRHMLVARLLFCIFRHHRG